MSVISFMTDVVEGKQDILSSIVTLLLAIIVIVVAVKILKEVGKSLFIFAVVVGALLLFTGIIDFAMIKEAGYGLWDWLLKTEAYQSIADKIDSIPTISTFIM